MHNTFQRSPFIRITLAFMAGVYIGQYINWTSLFYPFFYINSGILILIFSRNKTYLSVKFLNYLIYLTLFVSGIFYQSKFYTPPFKSLNKQYLLIELQEKPIEKTNSYCALTAISNPKEKIKEKALCYFSKTDYDCSLATGDLLIAHIQPLLIKNNGNPFEFDYKGMMGQKGIAYSIFLRKEDYIKTKDQSFSIKLIAEKVRDCLLKKLAASHLEGEELAVVSALTLGYKKELDQETRNYFSSAGAMHVLAVSGLHVGLIYLIISYILSFLKRTSNGTFIFSLTVIFLLWSYAFLTGLSPSVMRATIMFSFILIGENMRRPVNIFNSLAASAFILILIDPDIIYEVGFQLSYLAVIGIVTIQPGLSNLIEWKNPVIKKIWLLTTVSVAAQISTFPLGLYYFNQFPNLFWLSNLFVIPISSITIIMTLCYFIISPFATLPKIISTGIHYLVNFMIFLLKQIESVEWSVCKGIILNQPQVWMLYLILGLIILFFVNKQKSMLILFLITIVIMQIDNLYIKSSLLNQRKVIVYNTDHLLIHLINGRKNYLITNQKNLLLKREIQLAEKVKQHLNLNIPDTIDIDLIKNYHSEDLLINTSLIQFLSCQISLQKNEINITQKTVNQTSIKKNPVPEKNMKLITTIIKKNSYQKYADSEEEVYLLKKSGAYITDI